MARISKAKNFDPIIASARNWTTRCLVQDGSILSDESLWTPDLLSELKGAFSENLAPGAGKFIEKLEKQMLGASPAARRLMAEHVWALLLFTTSFGSGKKREYIKRIWDSSGQSLSLDHNLLTKAVLSGIGHGGPGFNAHIWREMAYLIEIGQTLKRESQAERDAILRTYERFTDWVTRVPRDGDRQFRHMLRYLLFPDRVERIATNRDRHSILRSFNQGDNRDISKLSDVELDSTLSDLRKSLESDHPGVVLDFYEPPLSSRWRGDRAEIEAVLQQYYKDNVIFHSGSHGARYAIISYDDSGIDIARLDGTEPARVTFTRLRQLVAKVAEAGAMVFSELDGTSAVRAAALQAPDITLTGDRATVTYSPDIDDRLRSFFDVIAHLNMQTSYKPAMLLAVLQGIAERELKNNRIPFDWVAPRFIAILQERGIAVTETQAAMPFYHLTGDLFWMHALNDIRRPMQDGNSGAGAARSLVKFAVIKETYWELLQDTASLEAVIARVRELLPSPSTTSMSSPSLDRLLPDAELAFKDAGLYFQPQQVCRFVCALATKPFVILTGLAGSGKTKLAQVFARWITPPSTSKDPFFLGAKVPSEKTIYEVSGADTIAIEFKSEVGTRVMLPREMIREWADHIRSHAIPRTTSARVIREQVTQLQARRFSDQLHSFETHLKAAAFTLLDSDDSRLPAKSYSLIPVGADWVGNENLLGYPDALHHGLYVPKAAIELIMQARDHPKVPHFLILDEMNLSHVERYFADFLSALESGEELQLHHDEGRTAAGRVIPPRVQLPTNLFIVGTVNVDETTYMFSPKVLDRANVIEFRVGQEEITQFMRSPTATDLVAISGRGSQYAQTVVELAQEKSALSDDLRKLLEAEMMRFFDVLRAHGAEFGFRVANDAGLFLQHWVRLRPSESPLEVEFTAAFDCIIFQKLLPKLHGSRAKLGPLIKDLWRLCLSADYSVGPAAKLPEPTLEACGSARYPLSADKLFRMWRLLLDNGFTSFAEA